MKIFCIHGKQLNILLPKSNVKYYGWEKLSFKGFFFWTGKNKSLIPSPKDN